MRQMKYLAALAFSIAAILAAEGAVQNPSLTSVTAGTPNIVVTPSPGVTSFTIGSTVIANVQSGSAYTIVAGDATKVVERTYTAAAFTDTLPNVSTTGFGAGFGVTYCAGPITGAKNATLNVTSPSTINGASSLSVNANSCVWISDPDGTNYVSNVDMLPLPSGDIYVGQTGGFVAAEAVSADCTLATSGAVTCTKLNGVSPGTIWSQGAGAVALTGGTINGVVIGGTTAAAGTFSSLTDTAITGSTQCVQVNTSGVLAGTGAACGGSGSTGANPSATAGPTAVNGSATTFLRSDGAPAIQKASNTLFGIAEVDNSTITAAAGVISAASTTVNSQTCTPGSTCTVWSYGGGFNYSTSIAAGVTDYAVPSGGFSAIGTPINFSHVGINAIAKTVGHLHAAVGVAPGTGNTVTFTLDTCTNYTTCTDTALTCQVSGTNTLCAADDTDTVPLSADQLVTMKVVVSASATSTGGEMWAFEEHQ